MSYILELNFDEVSGNTVTDYSGAGNNADLTGSSLVRSATGHTNKGLTQSGSTPATLPDIGKTSNRSFMCWVKNIEDIGTGFVWEQHVPPSVDSAAWGLLVLSGQVHVQARNGSTLARASAALPSSGTYHHFGGTFDGSTVRLYIDGSQAATASLTGPLRTDTNAPIIGEYSATTTIIDDFRLADHVVDATEMSSKMSTPVGSTGSQTVVTQLISTSSSIFNPQIIQIVNSPVISASSTIFSPGVEQIINPTLLNAPSSLFSPGVLVLLQIITAQLISNSSILLNPIVLGGVAPHMTGSIADIARVNMLVNRTLTEPRRETNVDLMALVLADGAQTLVPKTNASIGTHLLRYMMSLRN